MAVCTRPSWHPHYIFQNFKTCIWYRNRLGSSKILNYLKSTTSIPCSRMHFSFLLMLLKTIKLRLPLISLALCAYCMSRKLSLLYICLWDCIDFWRTASTLEHSFNAFRPTQEFSKEISEPYFKQEKTSFEALLMKWIRSTVLTLYRSNQYIPDIHTRDRQAFVPSFMA